MVFPLLAGLLALGPLGWVILVVLLIISFLLINAVFSFVASVLPIVIGIAVVVGLLYLIVKIVASPSRQSQEHESQNDEIVSVCQSIHDSPGDVQDCARRGGLI